MSNSTYGSGGPSPDIRVIYRLSNITYLGEDIGDDWTFYLHTGAGLVRLEAKIAHDREERRDLVIGVSDFNLAGGAVEFEHELWWASAIERDVGRNDRGEGMFLPVAIPLELGVRLRRTLEFEVAEIAIARDKVARLRLEIEARVERGDLAAPQLDATLIPAPAASPWQTAGRLPDRFNAKVEGLDGNAMPVVGERRLLVDRDYAGADPRARALAEFLKRSSGFFVPSFFEPRAALYELRNPNGRRFWADQDSSMGRSNHRRIVDAFADASPIGSSTAPFMALPSLVDHLLTPLPTAEFGPAAAAMAELVASLVSRHPQRAMVDRQMFVRTVKMDEHSGELTRAFFIDPTPFASPDMGVYMVAWTDAYLA